MKCSFTTENDGSYFLLQKKKTHTHVRQEYLKYNYDQS
jgi:hypothetical protein